MTWGILFAFAQAFLLANTTIVLRSLAVRLNPYLINALCGLVGLAVIIPLVLATGGQGDYRLLTLTNVLCLAVLAVGGVVGDALYLTALKSLGVGRAFPIANSYPLFTVLGSVAILGERLRWTAVAGMVVVLMGTYLIARPKSHVVGGPSAPLSNRQLVVGVLQALTTALIWGINTVLLASLGLGKVNSVVINSVVTPMVVIVSTAIYACRGSLGAVRALGRRQWLLLAVAGSLGWGLGGSLYVAAVQLAGPSRTAIIGTTSPLFAVPLSLIFLHERPTWNTLAGTVLTVAGIILIL